MPLIDAHAAAARLSLSPFTIRAYVRAGKIDAVKIGNRIRFTEDQIARFIDQNTPKAA